MTNVLRTVSTLFVQDVTSGVMGFGGIPQSQEEVLIDSSAFRQGTQVVGTTHEAIAAGDVADSAMCLIRNMHATAVISVGIEESAVFYPLLEIPPGETAKLPRLTSLAGTFLKSDEADTPVVVSLYEIVAPT